VEIKNIPEIEVLCREQEIAKEQDTEDDQQEWKQQIRVSIPRAFLLPESNF
jgi:hypothetical protein